MPYQLLADVVLVLHFGVVLFVVGGLAAVVVGKWRHWHWVADWRFRLTHLAAIACIAVQAWLGQWCPLTRLESWLRVQAGAASYERSFVEHWLQQLIYYEAPPWVFTLAYTAFAVLVLWAWWRIPPRRGPRRDTGGKRASLRSLPKQRHGDTGTDGIVDFRHSIGFAQQQGNRVSAGRGLDDGAVANVHCCQTHAGKLGACLDANALDRNVQAPRLAIEVVAVAGRQGEHQELATVDRGTAASGLCRDRDRLRHRASADACLVSGGRARDRG